MSTWIFVLVPDLVSRGTWPKLNFLPSQYLLCCVCWGLILCPLADWLDWTLSFLFSLQQLSHHDQVGWYSNFQLVHIRVKPKQKLPFIHFILRPKWWCGVCFHVLNTTFKSCEITRERERETEFTPNNQLLLGLNGLVGFTNLGKITCKEKITVQRGWNDSRRLDAGGKYVQCRIWSWHSLTYSAQES